MLMLQATPELQISFHEQHAAIQQQTLAGDCSPAEQQVLNSSTTATAIKAFIIFCFIVGFLAMYRQNDASLKRTLCCRAGDVR
jgi:hypothetical protein